MNRNNKRSKQLKTYVPSLSLPRSGFTLLELVITVGVMAIVIGVTSGILVALVKANQKAELLGEMNRSSDNAFAVLEEDIRASHDIKCVDGSNTCSAIRYTSRDGVVSEVGLAQSTCTPGDGTNGYIYKHEYTDPVQDGNTTNYNVGANEGYKKITNDDGTEGINVSALNFTINDQQRGRVTIFMEVKNSACNPFVENTQAFTEQVVSRVER